MARQLLDPIHVLSTYALLSLPPFLVFKPQLPSEPPLKGAGLVPLVFSALGTQEACALPCSPAHGDARSETASAHPQQPGLPPHCQRCCQAEVPHGGHGLPLYHVLRGGKSGDPPKGAGEGPSIHHLPVLVRKKSDLEVKERAWRLGERVGGALLLSGPQSPHLCQDWCAQDRAHNGPTSVSPGQALRSFRGAPRLAAGRTPQAAPHPCHSPSYKHRAAEQGGRG